MNIKATVESHKDTMSFDDIKQQGVYYDPDDGSYAVVIGFFEGAPQGFHLHKGSDGDWDAYNLPDAGWSGEETVAKTDLNLEITLK